MRCTRHNNYNCIHSMCRQERERRESTSSSTDTTSELTDPFTLPGSAVFDAFAGPSSTDCDTSSSSYDSGSSGSYDSGSPSDCGSY